VLAAVPAAHHSSGIGIAWLILAGFGAAIVRVVQLYRFPFRKCGRCKGTGVNRGSTGKRFGVCKACGGSRRAQRFGSQTLHKAIQSARSEWQRERALKREERVKERTRNPREQGGGR
jgi:hypothetical protein